MVKKLEPWEIALLESTRAFVKKATPQLPPDKREQVALRIYQFMHRTLAKVRDDK